MKEHSQNIEARPRGRAPWLRRGLRRLFLGLLVLCTSALLVEGAARLAGEPPGVGLGADDPAALHLQVLVNGWGLLPSMGLLGDCAHYTEEILDGRTPPGADAEVEISPQGFRDTPLVMPKPAGQIRILLLGDSSVFGANICRLDTLAELLEADLNAGAPEALPDGQRAVEVINAGVPGYSSYQSLEVLDRALVYGLDGVIVYSMISDWGEPLRIEDDLWFSRWAPVLRVLGHSAAVRWAHHLVTPVVVGAEPHDASGSGAPGAQRVHVLQYMDNLRRMVSETRAAGAWIAFVVPPIASDVETGGLGGGRRFDYVVGSEREAAVLWDDLNARVQDSTRRTSPVFGNEAYRAAMALVAWEGRHPVLDGPAVLRAAAASPDSLMLDTVHPAPAGNRALARELAPIIAGLLDGGAHD